MGAQVGDSLTDVPGLDGLMEKLPTPQSGQFEYQEQGREHFLNVRYIPELEWYLFVDKQDKALAGIRQGLYINLLLCLLVTVIVLTLVSLAIRRYQRRIAALATTDSLTDLPNRRGFDILSEQALQEAQRDSSPLCAVLLDLDNFKLINDQHGHLAGDQVLHDFAQQLRGKLRQSDILCRWGGEEFILLLKNTDRQAAHDLAENCASTAPNSAMQSKARACRSPSALASASGIPARACIPCSAAPTARCTAPSRPGATAFASISDGYSTLPAMRQEQPVQRRRRA